MRLKALTIKNFKGIDERGCRIEFAPITLLFGPNNAGKSTIIQALHLAQEILCRPDVDLDKIDVRGDGLNLGTFQDYVHKHELSREVAIKLEIKIEGQELFLDYDENIKNSQALLKAFGDVETIGLELVVGICGPNNTPNLLNYSIEINGINLTTIYLDYKINHTLAEVEYFNFYGYLSKETQDKLYAQSEEVWKLIEKDEDYGNELLDIIDGVMDGLEPSLKQFASARKMAANILCSYELAELGTYEEKEGFSCKFQGYTPTQWCLGPISLTSSKTMANNILVTLVFSPLEYARKLLSSFLYIGPLRAIPERRPWRRCKPSAERWANGLSAWDEIIGMSNKELESINLHLGGKNFLNTYYKIVRKKMLFLDADSELVHALKKMFKSEMAETDLPLLRKFLNQTPETRLLFYNEKTGIEVEPHDMGTGISQLIPCIVAAVIARNGQLVAIEQPELHIHPAWQTALADVFVNAIANKDNPPLFLLETHSEHLLLRLLRRIRQTNQGTAPDGLHLVPNGLAVYWIGSHDNQTEIYPLEIDEEGSFTTPWPEGFFEERAEELFG